MNNRKSGYEHWRGASTSIWRRRWTITQYGLRLCWRSRLLRTLFAIAWVSALGVITLHFLIGQLLSPDSAFAMFVAQNFGRKAKALLDGMTAWILLYPEITVDGLFRFTLLFMSLFCGTLSCIAVALFVPRLISQDLSSRAILIYNSKALTRADYLAGKFGIALVLLAGLLLAPLACIWFVSNVFSPDWSFFWHGFPALLRTLAAAAITVVSLSVFALAVSSLVKRSGAATALWIVLWLVSGFVAEAASHVFPWGRYLSPMNCLREITRRLLDTPGVIAEGEGFTAVFESAFKTLPRGAANALTMFSGEIWIPLAFLIGFCGLSVLAVGKRVKSE